MAQDMQVPGPRCRVKPTALSFVQADLLAVLGAVVIDRGAIRPTCWASRRLACHTRSMMPGVIRLLGGASRFMTLMNAAPTGILQGRPVHGRNVAVDDIDAAGLGAGGLREAEILAHSQLPGSVDHLGGPFEEHGGQTGHAAGLFDKMSSSSAACMAAEVMPWP